MLLKLGFFVSTISACLLLLTLTQANEENSASKVDWNRFVQPELQRRCDSMIARYSGQPDSADRTEFIKMQLKDTRYFSFRGQSLLAIMYGCLVGGEVVIVDSLAAQHIYARKSFSVTGIHFSFGDFKDLNRDGYPEIEIGLSGGNRGPHIYFLSIFPDSLSFIKAPYGGYDFYAMNGYRIEDSDKDGVFEIKLWDDFEENKATKYTTFRFVGQQAVEVQKNEK